MKSDLVSLALFLNLQKKYLENYMMYSNNFEKLL